MAACAVHQDQHPGRHLLLAPPSVKQHRERITADVMSGALQPPVKVPYIYIASPNSHRPLYSEPYIIAIDLYIASPNSHRPIYSHSI